MSRTYAEVVDARRKELDELRGKYQLAKAQTVARIDGPELTVLARLLRSYVAGEPPEKAVYIVAQASMLVNKMAEPFAIIDAFDQKKEALEQLEKNLVVTG